MAKYSYFILTILSHLAFILTEDQIFNIKDFRSNPMGIAEREDLFRVHLGVDKESRILAYVDFNNDKYVDIITAVKNSDQTESLKFFKYVYDQGLFVEDSGIKFKPFSREKYIKNLIANDINNDNYLDFVMTIQNTESGITTTEVHIFDPSENDYKIKFTKDSHGVFLGDFNGDRLVDFMFYDKSKMERRIGSFKNQTYVETSFSTFFFSNSTKCDGNQIYNNMPISIYHSSAFVDIDGDCQSDLVISSHESRFDNNTNTTVYTKYIEIWRGTMENNQVKYCLTKGSVYEIDDRMGPFTIADINRDGLLDIVFPIMKSANILISLNKIKLNFDWSADYCATHTNSNLTEIPELFERLSYDNAPSNYTSIVTLSDNQDEEFYNDKWFSPVIRIADINSDSYPDLLAVTIDKNTSSHKVRVYLNTQNEKNKLSRTFYAQSNYFIPINNTVQASFFDIDENGQLDILLVIKNDSGTYETVGYYNNYIYDAFFLKSVTLLTKDIFFSNELGANYRYISTNLDGSRRMDVSFQGIQSGNQYLNLPSAFIGIGRSNNYIENFHVISNTLTDEDRNYKIFTPIIPNSQLIISKTLDTSADPPVTVWELDLIVKPTSQLFILVITIVIILVVILGIIIYLHIKEVNEDKETENKNFIAWYS